MSRIESPIIFDPSLRFGPRGVRFRHDRPGFYLVVFYRGARLIGIDAGTLPPLDRFPATP